MNNIQNIKLKITVKKQRIDKYFASFCMFALVGLSFFNLPVFAADNATVTATVTVQNISVSVSDGTVAYGTLGTNSTAGTNGSDTQTVTNTGNVAEDFLIKGSNSASWTLNTANSTSDNYIHRFCIATCASAPTNFTALTTSNQTLSSSVAASGTQTFDLHITTPQTSTVFVQQSVDVTITATAS